MDQYDTALYCKVFLRTEATSDEIFQLLAQLAGGVVSGRRILSNELVIDFNRNKDFDATRLDREVYWPFFLDVNMAVGKEPGSYKGSLLNLLRTLRAKNISTAPACDFEDELSG